MYSFCAGNRFVVYVAMVRNSHTSSWNPSIELNLVDQLMITVVRKGNMCTEAKAENEKE